MLEENILKENFSDNQNVVFLIGHLRTVKYLLKYHKKFLDQTKSDLIISTWTDDDSEQNLIEDNSGDPIRHPLVNEVFSEKRGSNYYKPSN